MDTIEDAQTPDGYYGDGDVGDDELDLSFLDDKEEDKEEDE